MLKIIKYMFLMTQNNKEVKYKHYSEIHYWRRTDAGARDKGNKKKKQMRMLLFTRVLMRTVLKRSLSVSARERPKMKKIK